jgi:hypothetical protein
MAQELKHVGRLKETGKKCIVAFRTLPGDAYNCLVVPTEGLEDSYHNAIINLVESPAGQQAYEFAEAMDRTQFPDGSRMLPSLHGKGKLVKIQTDRIEMVPRPGVSISLAELNQIIAEQRGVPVDELSIKPASNDEQKEVAKAVEAKVEAVAETAPVAAPEGSAEEQAKFYRSQADKLAKQAAEMRRKAEELVPTKKAK